MCVVPLVLPFDKRSSASRFLAGCLIAALAIAAADSSCAATPAELTKDLLQEKKEIPGGDRWTIALLDPHFSNVATVEGAIDRLLYPACDSKNTSLMKKMPNYVTNARELRALLQSATASDRVARVRYEEEYPKQTDVRFPPATDRRGGAVTMAIWEFPSEEAVSRFGELLRKIAGEALVHLNQRTSEYRAQEAENLAAENKRKVGKSYQLSGGAKNFIEARIVSFGTDYDMTPLGLGKGDVLLRQRLAETYYQRKGSNWVFQGVTHTGAMHYLRCHESAFIPNGTRVLVVRTDCGDFGGHVRQTVYDRVDGELRRVESILIDGVPMPLATMRGIIRSAYYKMAHESPPAMEDGEGIPLEVKVYAKGHETASEYFRTDVDPSEIVISGNVRDQYGNPVDQALVVLVEKNEETKTLADGTYLLRASHDGSTPYETALDFMLLKHSSGLAARWESPLNITANAGESSVVLELADEDGPVRNQEVDISGTQGFRREGQPIGYVWDGGGNSRRLTTDQRGRLRFRIRHPDSVKQLPGNLTGDTAFPVLGALKVRVLESNTSTVAEYAVKSPFPVVSEMETGRFLEAGQWQIDPSEISIEDRDSDAFIITLEGPGAFKALGDTASQGRGHPRYLSQDIEGKTFRFHYKPNYQGFDLNNQPKVWKEIAELGGTIYLSVLTNVGGGKMLDKVALYFPGQSFTRAFLINDKGVVSTVYVTGKLQKASNFATKTLKGASHVSNFCNVGFKGYANQDEIVKTLTGQGSTEDLIVTVDNAIGLFDTGLGFTSLNPKGAAYWEALKASWEADKVAYKISKQYYDIAEAYQDLMSEEVTVTVEDETGRKAQAVGEFKVLVWKGGD